MTPAVASDPALTIHDTLVRLVRGDITEMKVDAFVYYAQPDLALGSGFGGAIAMRGGASIQKELNGLVEDGPLPTGQAVVTGAGKMNAEFIIHAVGPRFKEPETAEKLQATVLGCLARAEEKGIRSLAFPLMGAGYYGIPPEVSASVMLGSIRQHLQGESGLREITISVFDTAQFNAVQAALAAQG